MSEVHPVIMKLFEHCCCWTHILTKTLPLNYWEKLEITGIWPLTPLICVLVTGAVTTVRAANSGDCTSIRTFTWFMYADRHHHGSCFLIINQMYRRAALMSTLTSSNGLHTLSSSILLLIIFYWCSPWWYESLQITLNIKVKIKFFTYLIFTFGERG